MPGQLGFFDLEDRYAQLSKAGVRWRSWPPWWISAVPVSAAEGAEAVRWRKGGRPPYDPMFGTLTRTNGVRSLTVQDFDPSSALWDVRRSGGIPDPRPVDVHPLSRAWARRRSAGCQDHLAIPGAPHQGGCR